MRSLVHALLLLCLAAPAVAQELSSARPIGGGPAEFGFEQALGFELDAATAKGPAGAEAMRVVARFLGLSEDQVESWRALLEDAADQAEPIRGQIKANDEQLRQLLGGASPDPAAVGNLVITNVGLHKELGAIHQATVKGFEELLEEEQLRRLQSVRHAARIEPVIPAFRLFGLVAPPPPR